MQHSMRKSTQFAPRIVPSLNETSVHSVQEGSTAISQSHFVQNMALDVKVTVALAAREAELVSPIKYRVRSQNSRCRTPKAYLVSLGYFITFNVSAVDPTSVLTVSNAV